jgi:hypothetical protein
MKNGFLPPQWLDPWFRAFHEKWISSPAVARSSVQGF